jgi:hypothetical protein
MSFDLKIKNGDFVLDNGDLKKVKDAEKLTQSVLKICLTEAGTNPLHPWYGSHLSRTVIGSVLDPSITETIAKTQLETSLNNLKEIQETQLKSYQDVSPDEQISAILNIDIVRNRVDPRIYEVLIKILSKGLKLVSTGFTISNI